MPSKVIEFKDLSEAREVVEHKIPNFMLWFFYFVLGLLTLALVWSYFGKKEIVVQASGMVKTEETQSVIPLVNTSVLNTYFGEGAFVNKGDLILELDGRSIEADKRSYQNALSSIEEDLTISRLYLTSVQTDTNLFELTNIDHVTKYYEMETYLDLLNDSTEPVKFKQTKIVEVTENINQQEQTIDQYENEIEKLDQQLEQYKIYAQYDGVIHFVYDASPGSTVVSGQELLRVHKINEEDKLTVQFLVLNQDIAKIHVGQKVRVEVPALSVRTYGYAQAEVIEIETDSRFDQSSGQSFYLVTAKLSSNQLSSDDSVEDIKIGMQVMGRLITDEQRYLYWAIEKLELWIFR
ncbi:HlyD family secretion protein [Mycoplasmatota bacterium]|nr:HlyD family secretion protein [Mycoplasmatota bacterium]